MKRLILILLLLLITTQGWADSGSFTYWDSADIFGGGSYRLPGAAQQTAFLPFDSSLGTAQFVRNGGAVNPDTGLWANENILLQSNAFTTTWAATGTPAATQNAVDPFGNANTAWTLTDNSGSVYEGVSQSVTVRAGDLLVYSVYVAKKASSPAYPLVQFSHRTQATGLTTGVLVNEVAGTIHVVDIAGYTAPVASTITDAGTFWRVEVSAIQEGTTLNVYAQLYPSASADGVTVSDTQGSTVFYGAQLQRGSTAGAYLATTTAAKYDQPRYVTGKDGIAAHALLVEESSTNLYLNSAALATQNVTTSATTYTASFWGTGTITFSGTYSGSLVGTGAADRVQKTFTATAGTLTSTVSGTVTNAQIGALPYATSYIPTTTAAVTRAAEYATQATSGVIAAAQGTVMAWGYVDTAIQSSTSVNHLISHGTSATANIIRIWKNGANTWGMHVSDAAGTTTGADVAQTLSAGWHHFAITWGAAGTKGYIDGAEAVSDTTGITVPASLATNYYIGSRMDGTLQWSSKIDNVRAFSTILTQPQIAQYANRGK